MSKRLEELKASGTLKPSSGSDGRSLVGGKWVFKWKTNEVGVAGKAKARLVAKWFA